MAAGDSAEWLILGALVEACRDITGLHPEFGPEARMVLPAMIPLLGWDHNTAWGDLQGPINGSIYVLFRYGVVGRDGYKLMMDYTSPVGPKSITQAIMATHLRGDDGIIGALPTDDYPDGVVAGVRIGGALTPRAYTYGDGVLYWGRELPIRIIPKEL